MYRLQTIKPQLLLCRGSEVQVRSGVNKNTRATLTVSFSPDMGGKFGLFGADSDVSIGFEESPSVCDFRFLDFTFTKPSFSVVFSCSIFPDVLPSAMFAKRAVSCVAIANGLPCLF